MYWDNCGCGGNSWHGGHNHFYDPCSGADAAPPIAEQLLVGHVHFFSHILDAIQLIAQLLQFKGAVIVISGVIAEGGSTVKDQPDIRAGLLLCSGIFTEAIGIKTGLNKIDTANSGISTQEIKKGFLRFCAVFVLEEMSEAVAKLWATVIYPVIPTAKIPSRLGQPRSMKIQPHHSLRCCGSCIERRYLSALSGDVSGIYRRRGKQRRCHQLTDIGVKDKPGCQHIQHN